MPRIFDNIELQFLGALRETLIRSKKADFCVGYFKLRGWRQIDDLIELWPSGESETPCRVLVGMQGIPHELLPFRFHDDQPEVEMDQNTVLRLKKLVAEEFRQQLIHGIPTNADEKGLRRLALQLRARKLSVKLFLRHQLHAKLYLAHRDDPNNPSTAFVGSSNLSYSGLAGQGELNVDVLDHDSCQKLQRWFDARWDDRWCLDITSELAEIIENSWATPERIPPYHIYLKIAYHLSREARHGLDEFRVPQDFGTTLFDFQAAAVRIAAQYLTSRKGVILGDVVGLGKTIMATALARVFQDDHGTETLIICPKNLVKMWEKYVHKYRLLAKILPISQVQNDLKDLRRYRIVLIDESHNLRNREGRRFAAIQEYIGENDSSCILLSATPYNKSYLDLSAQLRLFLSEDRDLGIRPETKLREMGETEFIRRHQCGVRTLAAFEKSEYADDWRELMRLFLVRRTRSFIQANYAELDSSDGRKFLRFDDGRKSYFPTREPKTVKFTTNQKKGTTNQYSYLFSSEVLNKIEQLKLPRYGLGNYVLPALNRQRNQNEDRVIAGLSRAGKRLMGVCRTNLFKRLESGGPAFLKSVQRHVLRNFVYIFALNNGLPVPIGAQDSGILSSDATDSDIEDLFSIIDDDNDQPSELGDLPGTVDQIAEEAEKLYQTYKGAFQRRFRWLEPDNFAPNLKEDLQADADELFSILRGCGSWESAKDEKLNALKDLLFKRHEDEKILVFSQYADTVAYLFDELGQDDNSVAWVTGESEDPAEFAWRFSPVSNEKRDEIDREDEIRVLISTDVLSEGFNLQDCSVIVNFDLPWAIIRLIQRAGRVDRIGQESSKILCYTFLPAEGIERIIGLRRRVRERLRQNAEVVGTDEEFFEGERSSQPLLDIYNEKAGSLDGDLDQEVDLASHAYQIWKNAVDANPELNKIIPAIPPVAFSAKDHGHNADKPSGALVYVSTADGNDALAWIDNNGQSVSQSQLKILEMAACRPETPAATRAENHHDLVKIGVEQVVASTRSSGGQLGRPSGARFKTYTRLKAYLERIGTRRDLFITDQFVQALEKAIDDIYRYPLRQTSIDTLNRHLKVGIADEALARVVIAMREEDRLSIIQTEEQQGEAQIICSLGLVNRSTQG